MQFSWNEWIHLRGWIHIFKTGNKSMTRYNYSMSQNYLKSLPKQVHTPYILEKCWIVKKKEIVMVIKYNGSSGNVAHVGGKTDFDWKINFAFDDDVYLNNCLTPFSLHMCVSYFDQPSTSNTMEISGNGRRKVYISNFHKSCFYQKCRKKCIFMCFFMIEGKSFFGL